MKTLIAKTAVGSAVFIGAFTVSAQFAPCNHCKVDIYEQVQPTHIREKSTPAPPFRFMGDKGVIQFPDGGLGVIE